MAGREAIMIVDVLHAFAQALTCQVSIAPASADETSAEAGRLEPGPHSLCEVRIRRRGSASRITRRNMDRRSMSSRGNRSDHHPRSLRLDGRGNRDHQQNGRDRSRQSHGRR